MLYRIGRMCRSPIMLTKIIHLYTGLCARKLPASSPSPQQPNHSRDEGRARTDTNDLANKYPRRLVIGVRRGMDGYDIWTFDYLAYHRYGEIAAFEVCYKIPTISSVIGGLHEKYRLTLLVRRPGPMYIATHSQHA